MSQFFQIHEKNPQIRLVKNCVEILNKRGIIVYPTDSGYALGCKMGCKESIQRILDIRQINLNHHLTLVCADLSEIGNYAHIDNISFRLIKSLIPGSYTFILRATKKVPIITLHPKRKTIGVRIPDNKIALSILDYFKEPIVSCSLILASDQEVLTDIDDIKNNLCNKVDLIIDGGYCGNQPTSVIDLTDGIEIIRYGKGDTSIII